MAVMSRLTVDDLIELAGGVVQLGERLGVARTTVIGWRASGYIPGNRLAQISTTFNISADDLLSLLQPPRSGGSNDTPMEAAAA